MKNNLRKIISLMLILVMLCSVPVISVNAESKYPESSHPYANNTDEFYVYTTPDSENGLYITFSENTMLEADHWDFAPEDFNPEWSIDELYSHYDAGDDIIIYSNYRELELGEEINDMYLMDMFYPVYTHIKPGTTCVYGYDDYTVYNGKELSGRTVFVPGNCFAIRLCSDKSITDYGFKVEAISTELPENVNYVHYNLGEDSYYDYLYKNGQLKVNPEERGYQIIKPGYIIGGWATEPDGEIVYAQNDEARIPDPGYNLELYPVFTKEYSVLTYVMDGEFYAVEFNADEDMVISSYDVLDYNLSLRFVLLGWSEDPQATQPQYKDGDVIGKNADYTIYPVWRATNFDRSETFSFRHAHYNFPKGYSLTEEHYNRMLKNVAITFGINPLTLSIGGASFTYHGVFGLQELWFGSCSGMSVTSALQHEGYLDLLSEQNADCVYELEPTEELISTINYYQSLTAESTFAENLAITKGTAVYSQNIKNLYESAASGKISVITYFTSAANAFDFIEAFQNDALTEGHTVLAVGAYELPEDEVLGNFTRAIIIYNCNNLESYEVMLVADDFSELFFLSDDGGIIGSFKWLDDYSLFESFNIEGDSNPLSWHISVIKRFFEAIKTWFQSFSLLFTK